MKYHETDTKQVITAWDFNVGVEHQLNTSVDGLDKYHLYKMTLNRDNGEIKDDLLNYKYVTEICLPGKPTCFIIDGKLITGYDKNGRYGPIVYYNGKQLEWNEVIGSGPYLDPINKKNYEYEEKAIVLIGSEWGGRGYYHGYECRYVAGILPEE